MVEERASESLNIHASESLDLAVIGGDGIGPEVVAEGLKVLAAVCSASASNGLKVNTTEYDLGARRWLATGEVLPESVLQEIRGHDAILLGAVGDPSVPSGVLERGLLLKLRFALDQYVNLRPVRLYPGVLSPLVVERVAPNGIDFVVVREGTEGPYVGNGGALRVGSPAEIATEVSVNTRYGVERVVRDAFARAQSRPRKHLTLVHKHNVLVNAGDLWRRTVAAAVAGGIGLAASGNINPERPSPSMFEPVHGSAPDIAGQGKADPTAAILSVAMLLEHLGRRDEAFRVEQAVASDLSTRGGLTRSTSQVGDAIADLVG